MDLNQDKREMTDVVNAIANEQNTAGYSGEVNMSVVADAAGTQQTVRVKEIFREGQVLARHFTMDGVISIIWKDGRQFVQDIETASEIPEHLQQPKIVDDFIAFLYLRNTLAAQPNRELPVSMAEAEHIMGKQKVKNLARKGLVHIETLKGTNKGGHTESHAFCWPTAVGLALSNLIDEKAEHYTRKDHTEYIAKLQGEIQAYHDQQEMFRKAMAVKPNPILKSQATGATP